MLAARHIIRQSLIEFCRRHQQLFLQTNKQAFYHSLIKQSLLRSIWPYFYCSSSISVYFTTLYTYFFLFVFITQLWAPNDEFGVNDLPPSLSAFNTFHTHDSIRQALTFMSLTINQDIVFCELLDIDGLL